MIVVGYFPSWGVVTKSFSVMDVKGDLITHLHYAFANISEDGLCVVGDPKIDLGVGEDGRCEKFGGNFADLEKLKEKYPNLKVIISVGGWNWSKNFSKVAESEESREKFVKSCVETFIMGDFGSCGKHPGIFDGIDIDWEFPVSGGKYPGRPEDRKNYTLLLRDIRKILDEVEEKTGKHYTLSIAGGTSPDFIFKNTEMKEIGKIVDYVVVMTYDFHGSWSRTGFNSNLYQYDEDPTSEIYNVDTVISSYIAA
jgi:chitinase